MNKLLIITGGSRGIGEATIQRFLAAEFSVINLSRTPAKNPSVLSLSADFSQPDWLNAHATKLTERVQSAETCCVIHNTALLLKDTTQSAASDMARVFQVNVIAAMQLNALLIPAMRSGSSVLYTGSTLSDKAVANACSYSVSKHATLGLMRATCQDLAGTGIHTACVGPGFTDTEMLRAHVGHSDDILSALGKTTAFGRLIQPKEIAELFFFCAQNPVVNGSMLHANLGQIEH